MKTAEQTVSNKTCFDLDPTPEAAEKADRASSAELQTVVDPEILQGQLAKIRETARTLAEETGVSTLHLAFGFLEWFESDSSNECITSPLILLRVDIDRRIVRSQYQYAVTAAGDDAEINLTLSERLDRDFRVKLPDRAEDQTPERYLERVQADICTDRPRWSVRRFLTLAHFPYARLSMFQDLDEAQWSGAGGLAAHPVLASLLGGREQGESMFAEEHEIDAPEMTAAVPILVLPADASQHSAVFDVMASKDLVIEGPPGTGKSQTITNIIAAALSQNKRVLFVADKQAALQVVKDRLEKLGLGDFCLELHSGKSKKPEVLASFKQRIERRPVRADSTRLVRNQNELFSTRMALTRYVDLLNTRFGALGHTVHELIWADRRRRVGEDQEARWLDAIELHSPDQITAHEAQNHREVLAQLERASAPMKASFGKLSSHPWYGVTQHMLPSADIDEAVRDTADLAALMADVVKQAQTLSAFGAGPDMTLADLAEVATQLAGLDQQGSTHPALFAACAMPDMRELAQEWLASFDRYQDALTVQGQLLALPRDKDPLLASIELQSNLSAAGPLHPGLTAGGLPACAAKMRDAAARMADLDQLATAMASLLAARSPKTLAEASILAAAVQLAAATTAPVAAYVTPELMQAGSSPSVSAAAMVIRSARDRHAELIEQFSLAPGLTPETLRLHAATVSSSGLLAFMSPAQKAARQCYAGLLRMPQKPSKAEMTASLIRVAEHLETIRTIESGESYRHAFGSRYRGLATDVDTALLTVTWASQVRSSLMAKGPAGAGAESVLLSGDPARLEAIRAFSTRPDFATMLTELGQAPPQANSFSDAALHSLATAQSVESLAALCEGIGISAETLVDRLPGLCTALRRTAEADAAARPPDALAKVLNGALPEASLDRAPYAAAVQLAAKLERLDLPPVTKDALWRTAPETIQTVAIPAAHGYLLAYHAVLQRWAGLKARLALQETALFGQALADTPPERVRLRLELATANPGELGGWIAYLKERAAAEALKLGPLLALWDARTLPVSLPAAFDRVLHRALARLAFQRHPELERFTGLSQDEARSRFAALDIEASVVRREYLAHHLSSQPVPAGIELGKSSDRTERALILHEMSKQKRHISIRQLLARAGGAAQALKPCFMMSPLSVAQYLKPGGLSFDLLVIDEASQMRPEDAVGAVARCGQIVVVGDSKQLPPTNRFDRGDSGDDEAEQDVDVESILDLAQRVFRPARRLRWHYRSRHGSLVAFSNREFYDEDLLVFPSPAEAAENQGVSSVFVGGLYKAHCNEAEAKAVCEAALHHMRTRPDRSLGIATMNKDQREMIAMEMDRLAAQHPDIEAYRERWSGTLERFFVKNLENVQGDERDVIFISTVFGPAEPGARVRQSFGINGASGHRRLNVLFTRAKHQVRLFTSMRPEDILTTPESPRGVRVLKAYLAYAQTGRLEAGQETGREADSDFEVFVRDRLLTAGYEAVPQVGVSGYFIDLAVRDPASPATFLLGIECDGATYHSSRSARDRDILRQQILEGLGWTIYRIWSTDWFRDPEGQGKKLLSFIENVLRARPSPKPTAPIGGECDDGRIATPPMH